MVTAKSYTGHIRLRRLGCIRAVFEQPVPVSDPAFPEGRISADLEYPFKVGLKATESDEGTVRVELAFRASRDREAGQPYSLEVVYLGEFELSNVPEGLSRDAFARQNAAAILFPYLREAVSSVTARGTYGPLFVPPINVVAMLRREASAKTKAPQKTGRAKEPSKGTGGGKGKTAKARKSTA